MTDDLQNGGHRWPKPVKGLILGFLVLLISGVSVGLIYLFTTTSLSTTGTIEHYNGSDITSQSSLNIPEKYAKPVSELLLTTHNHFIGFSFIFTKRPFTNHIIYSFSHGNYKCCHINRYPQNL